ncbi:protein RRP6-like 2 [Cocos nucifera]|uniref:Protein RRP6-like 2 n=1 Tax=Cocos nucifera TaxID=13894 RepID=A0A8K0I1Q6_COCNU|nr:protein RRP6-like 2 [Cocos nucifera]
MEEDFTPPESSLKHKAEALQALVSGPLAAASARLSGRSRGIPSGKDFHFYNNFDEFKAPAREIAAKSESSLRDVAALGPFWGSKKPPRLPDDLDDAFDWLVNLNDEFLERFGISVDEFKGLREKEEENGGKISSMDLDGGFQMVYGKKKKGNMQESEKDDKDLALSLAAGVKEKLSILDFLDRNIGEGEPVKPLPVESTPFKLVEGLNELKELASKLQGLNEFAIGMISKEYLNWARGKSERDTLGEDFIIDTLKLRIHVGPYLREIFKDPSKRKVMHGADRDISWLQRDFGIYLCNLFDTGQASRILQLERNSLEHLLRYFCGVNANKEYQNADWRLRPLPDEMLKYAREDTHYLLHIYDLMKSRLISASTNENDLLLEVYKRSSEICMQLYEKELLTDTSYLHIYGLQEADFNVKQLAVVAGLFQWRDSIARAEDESTGYILPNKTLLEIGNLNFEQELPCININIALGARCGFIYLTSLIFSYLKARQTPVTSVKVRRLVKSKHPFVERYIDSVISIIRSSIANSAAFERIAVQLKKGRLEASPKQDMEPISCNSNLVTAVGQDDHTIGTRNIDTTQSAELAAASTAIIDDCAKSADSRLFSSPISAVGKCHQEEKSDNMSLPEIGCSLKLSDTAGTMQKMDGGSTEHLQPSRKCSVASVQILRKPSRGFGALLGNSSSRRKFNADKGGNAEQVKNDNKVEQIKSTVALPFHYFSGGEKLSEVSPEVNLNRRQVENQQQCTGYITEAMNLEEVMPLENELDNLLSAADSLKADDGKKHREWFPPLQENSSSGSFQPESDNAEGLASPLDLDLSSSFEKSFWSINERRSSHQNHRSSQEPEVNHQLKPFDYAAARKNMKFGEVREKDRAESDNRPQTSPVSGEMRKGLASGRSRGEEKVKGFQQPRRRQAFPPSGNRSTAYH